MVNHTELKKLSLAKNPDFESICLWKPRPLYSNYKYDNLSLKVSMVYIIWFRRYNYEAIWNGVKFYKIQVKAWVFLKIWRKKWKVLNFQDQPNKMIFRTCRYYDRICKVSISTFLNIFHIMTFTIIYLSVCLIVYQPSC